MMKKALGAKGLAVLAGLAFVLAGPLAAASDRDAERYEEKFSKTEALERDGRVSISNVSGNVDVRSWDQAQVKIEAVKISRASTVEKAKENAAKVTIEVEKTGNVLQIRTKYPDSKLFRNDNINVSVNYQVWVPDKASVRARSVSGNVGGVKIGGAFETDVTSGNTVVSGVVGGVEARSVSGDVQIGDVQGDVSVRAVSGTIRLDKSVGSVDVETTSGDVELGDMAGARSVRAKVLSGNLTYAGGIAAGGKYSFEALSGNIRLTLPADAAFELDASTFSGRIQTDFQITVSGKIAPRELQGVVGAGGATLRVKCFSGGVEIRKK